MQAHTMRVHLFWTEELRKIQDMDPGSKEFSLFLTKFENLPERVPSAENVSTFRHHALPLARIKKIMKTDEDVKV